MDILSTPPSLIMSSVSMPCARVTVSNGADEIMLDETVIVPNEEPTTNNVLKEQPVIFQQHVDDMPTISSPVMQQEAIGKKHHDESDCVMDTFTTPVSSSFLVSSVSMPFATVDVSIGEAPISGDETTLAITMHEDPIIV